MSLELKSNFKKFLLYFFDKIENAPDRVDRMEFKVLDFHNDIIGHLQNLVLDKDYYKLNSVNLAINIPPRHGKSMLVCYWVAWCYAINQGCNFIYTSYSMQLALTMSMQIKRIIQSEYYFALFPKTKLGKNETAAEKWKIKNGGTFKASSLGGELTGFGAGVGSKEFGGAIIIDDPLKPEDARYDRMRINAIAKYTETLKSRKNSVSNTPFVMIMQRLHLEDLTGYALKNETEQWKHVKYACLNEKTNTALWEEKMSSKILLNLKLADPKIFYGQYQQEPIIDGGNLIKTNWFKEYHLDELKNLRINKIFIVGDTAFKVKEYNDFSVLTVFATDGKSLFVLDMLKGKWEGTPLEAQVVNLWNKWKDIRLGVLNVKCQGLHVEDKASGIRLIQDLRSKGIPVFAVQRVKDKLSRFYEAELSFSGGRIFLPLHDFKVKQEIIAECSTFSADMSHKHDDVVDTLIDGVQIGLSKISNIWAMMGKD